MTTPNRAPDFSIDAAMSDIARMAKAELARGVTSDSLEELGLPVPTENALDKRTFPLSKGRQEEAAFICSEVTEVVPVVEAKQEKKSGVPSDIKERTAEFRMRHPRGLPNSAKNATPRFISSRERQGR